MKKIPSQIFVIIPLLFVGTHSLAMDTLEGTQADRYTLERSGDKFVRLDRKTGKMSVCTFDNEELICREAKDERDALIEEIDRLTNLADQLSAKNKNGANEDTQSNRSKSDAELDAEIDRAIDYSSKIMRRFFEAMKDIREDFKSELK